MARTTIKYAVAVNRARKIVATQGKTNWQLGDIAANVETAYGDNTIAKLAEDINVNEKSLYDFKRISEAYPPADRGVASWTVHQVLFSQDDRADLVTEDMTVAAARALVKSRQTDDGDVAGDGDGDTDGDTDGDAPADDLPTQLAKATADRDRIAGELVKADAKIATIKAQMDAEIKAAAKAARPARARRNGSNVLRAA